MSIKLRNILKPDILICFGQRKVALSKAGLYKMGRLVSRMTRFYMVVPYIFRIDSGS